MRWLGPRSLNLTTPYGEVLCAGFASTSIITVFNCCFYYHIFLHLSGRETKAARAVANWLALLPPAVVILWRIYIFFSFFCYVCASFTVSVEQPLHAYLAACVCFLPRLLPLVVLAAIFRMNGGHVCVCVCASVCEDLLPTVCNNCA